MASDDLSEAIAFVSIQSTISCKHEFSLTSNPNLLNLKYIFLIQKNKYYY